MRIANLDGRAVRLASDTAVYDIESSSEGRFGPSPAGVYEQWESFTQWAAKFHPDGAPTKIDPSRLGPPSPRPSQIVAIGLNYADHAAEAGMATSPGLPPVFAKFASSLAGPKVTVALPPDGHTDWEVELVVVIGTTARAVTQDQAWDHVAGLTVGQDLSERITQMQGAAPQFGLGKSFTNFSPTGPSVVTLDELAAQGIDRDDLELGCSVDGEQMQSGRTRNLIYPVARLISELSQIITLNPGDLIFTGTPAGVGLGRSPQRFLRDGERLVSWITGIGQIEQTFTDVANTKPTAVQPPAAPREDR